MSSIAAGGTLSRGGATLRPLRLTENARKVLEARYLKKDESGRCVETPEELFLRVARAIADVELQYGASEAEREHWEERFYNLMVSGEFMPNSPTLMNAGREMGMLSACFVLPVRDSVVSIYDSIKHTALIQKAGGGTGFAFDELRPTGDYIASSGGTTSGPISFWRVFSEGTNAIQQGAFRRGANMGMMYIHHPDILKFLHAKQDLNQFTNYNISVKVTDSWMRDFLAQPDSPHIVRNPRTGRAYLIPRDVGIWEYDIRSLIPFDQVEPVDPSSPQRYYTTPRLRGEVPEHVEWNGQRVPVRGRVYTKRDIWDIIVRNAWQTGEPGVVFIDRINEHNPTPHVGRIEATNPCGEQPLLPYEACNLGSVNLGAFVIDPCTPQARVDWDRLRRTVHLATRFLDNVIDANNYPLDEIERMCRANRKIGLGIMGFADALYRLNVPYNSEEGVSWGERFMRFVNDEAHNYSEHLARIRGCFPNWKGSTWHLQRNRMMRNACTTTVAPTGTISIIANCSGGIEPMFSLAFIRNVLRGQKQGERPLVEVNETFLHVARERGFYSQDLIERVAREGTLADIPEVPDDVKHVFVCAHDISPEWHMRMQAAFQRHCDSSISKTINFPQSATPQDVETIYRLAFEWGCKGVTVYRDGCRECQPMALKKDAHGSGEPPATARPVAQPPQRASDEPAPTRLAASAISQPTSIEPLDLPEISPGLRIRQMTPFGNMHVKITVDPRSQRELEVFAQLGKGGDVATSDLEAICRMISLWLRAGGSLRHVIKQLEGIGSSLQIPTRGGRIMSLGDGLACALKKYQQAKERFGLRALLLSEVGPEQLDNPHRPPHSPDTMPVDRPLRAAPDVPRVLRGGLEPAVATPRAPSPARAMPDQPAVDAAPQSEPAPGTDRIGRHTAADTFTPGQPEQSRPVSAAPPRPDDRHAGNGTRVDPAARYPAQPADGGPAMTRAHLASSAARPVARQALAIPADEADPTAVPDLSGDSETAVALLEPVEPESLPEAQQDESSAGRDEPHLLRGPLADDQQSAAVRLEESNGSDNGQAGQALGAPGNGATSMHDWAAGYKLHCPQCDGHLSHVEGCAKCLSCGWSTC